MSERTTWRKAAADPVELGRWARSRTSLQERTNLAIDALIECDSCLERTCIPLTGLELDRFLVVHGMEPHDVPHPYPHKESA